MAVTVFLGDLSDFEVFEVNTIVDNSNRSPLQSYPLTSDAGTGQSQSPMRLNVEPLTLNKRIFTHSPNRRTNEVSIQLTGAAQGLLKNINIIPGKKNDHHMNAD
jgi:hypothetical protein